MDDIAPGLLEKITAEFKRAVSKDEKLLALRTATDYEGANAYALRCGELLSQILRENISAGILPDGRMYFNIARKILNPILKIDHSTIADVCEDVQTELNRLAGIGIKAQRPKVNQDRIDGLINKISNAEDFRDVDWLLGEPIKNFSQSTVDDSVKENIDFQSKAGLMPRVIRTVKGNCCEWCQNIAGSYLADEAPAEVYMRHENCRCTVSYDGTALRAYANRKGKYNTFRK